MAYEKTLAFPLYRRPVDAGVEHQPFQEQCGSLLQVVWLATLSLQEFQALHRSESSASAGLID